MRRAFVISGGGARGAFSLGALVGLKSLGIVPDVIYGSSVGAINAFGYTYCGLEKTEEIWRSLRSSDVMKFNFSSLFLRSDGVYSLSPLIKTMDRNGKASPGPIVSCAVSVDLCTGELRHVYSNEASRTEFIRACAASSAIPAVFSPVDGHIDGGVREIAPVKRAVLDGCDEIYVILNVPAKVSPGKIGNFIENGYRALSEILLTEILLSDIKVRRRTNAKIIFPETLFVDTLGFDNSTGISKSIAHGIMRAELLGSGGRL